MPETLCTVITPVYNCEKYIARALDSILMQKTTFYYNLWVINDGSGDGTLDIIMSYKDQFTGTNGRLTVFDKPHAGNTVHMLSAYRQLTTKYYTVLDADDYWIIDNKLQMAVDYMEAHDGCSAFANNFRVVNEDTGDSWLFTDRTDFNAEAVIDFNMQTSSAVFRSCFTPEFIDSCERWIGTPQEGYFGHDNFRNYYSFTKGYMRIDGTVGSVYYRNSGGIYSTKTDIDQNTSMVYNSLFFYEYLNSITDKDTKSLLFAARSFYETAVYQHAAALNSLAEPPPDAPESEAAKTQDTYTETGRRLAELAVKLSKYPELPRYDKYALFAAIANSITADSLIISLKDMITKYKQVFERQNMIIDKLKVFRSN